MKKFLAIMLAALTLVSLAACAAKTDTAAGETDTQIPDALTLLNTVWDSYTDDEKFPAAGGDYSEENMTDGKPGKVDVSNADNVQYLLKFPTAQVDKIDDAASLMHMMNGNTFTCGAFRVKDSADLADVAAAVKEEVMGTQWMCGFPDKLVVATVGNYLVEFYGAEDLINTFRDKLQAAYAGAVVITDEPIVV